MTVNYHYRTILVIISIEPLVVIDIIVFYPS